MRNRMQKQSKRCREWQGVSKYHLNTCIKRFLVSAVLSLGCIQAQALEVELGASEADAEVTVGCLYPLSGRGGLYGSDSAVGIQLAFEALEKQGLTYPQIRVLIADSRSKGSRTARLVRHFIHHEKARFLCGVVNSAIAA